MQDKSTIHWQPRVNQPELRWCLAYFARNFTYSDNFYVITKEANVDIWYLECLKSTKISIVQQESEFKVILGLNYKTIAPKTVW